ncbi:MAG: alpha-amylase [Muribaculaceae bacterium]|nr:alpha-amylase [Muribaculaceae bacterium]
MKKILATMLGACATLFGTAQEKTPATTVNHPDWSRNAVIYEVNVRQSTPEGTFEAFLPQIPRLKDLGVDILWFMPIHPISEDGRKGKLGSYYAVRDYKGVNPEFGNIDDFRKVVKAAHDNGMKVIIDWVPNHSGRDNAWVKNHPEWYQRNEKGEMFGPYDWTDVYKFDYSNPEMRKAMTDAMAFWLREADIDGFRCDVAFEVPTDFWNENRPQLEAVKPSIFMLAEAPNPELVEHGFDMDYNWPMKDLFSAIAATSGQYTFKGEDGNIKQFPEKHASDIYVRLEEEANNYPADSYLMNMTTNHDLNSWEGTEFERLGNLQEAFAVLMYTLPGMPLIYTGQEVGMNRAFEFFEKDEAPDWNSGKEVTAFYKKLNDLKHSRKELAAGSKEGAKLERLATASDDVIAFRRGNVITVANLGKTTVKPFKKAPSVKGMTNWMTGAPAALPKTMAPGEYLIFVGE